MQCLGCHSEMPADAEFCSECGLKLVGVCASCGAANVPAFKFCKKCGERPQAAAPASGGDSRSPRSYTPKHLAEKILADRSALEGERKQVTVLFADIKGSLELLEGRDPEDARNLLDPAVHIMMDAIHRYEGTVDKVMGDGIMALFGAPVAHEDHAVRASYAALAMQESMRRYTAEVRHSRGVELRIRVGLNSGEVVVRAIANDLHMDYSAVGQTVHLAARMEQLAIPGTIRMTAEAARLVEGLVELHSLGAVPVKGLAAPIEVFELTGVGILRTRLQAAAARGLTSFVGRQSELEMIRQALGRAKAGHGEIVALVGEPGIGKSRLVWEVTHSHRTAEWRVLEGTSVSYGKATAYLPVLALLRAYFQIETRDDERRIREKVTGRLLTLDPALALSVPSVLALLIASDDAEWQALDAVQRQSRTVEMVKRVLLREARAQPLLLIFEDLHWIDRETQALLDSLVESLPVYPILLLVNYRPEYRHEWASKGHYMGLRIDPLRPESADELLQALLGGDAGLSPLKQILIERTQGNPFFLEESVRALVETGALAGKRGDYTLGRPLGEVQVPETVQAVIAARIDRLPAEEKRLLQSASVIGKDVPYSLLLAVADLPEDALRGYLSRLQEAEFLYEASLFPDLEYTFKHALTHKVAYMGLVQERRRDLHGRIVAAIEQLNADRLGEHVERLAHHTARGEVWDKAVQYLRQAASRASQRSAYREAVAYCEQALEALKRLPESRQRFQEAIDVHFDLRNALLPLGESDRILEVLREAGRVAEALDDKARSGRVLAFMTQYCFFTGECDDAIQSGRRALALAAEIGDFDLQVLATFYLGQAYHTQGDYRNASGLFRQSMDALREDRVHDRFGLPAPLSLFAMTWLGRCLAELGEFAEGSRVLEDARRRAEVVNVPYSLIQAFYASGILDLRKGDVQKAIPTLTHGLELCRTWSIPRWIPSFLSSLGHAHALSGQPEVALPLLMEGLEQVDELKITTDHSLIVAWLAEAHLRAKRVADARPLAARALELARTTHERGHEAAALRLIADIAADAVPLDLDKAAHGYRQALAMAEELGMRPLVAECRFGLGRLYRRVGDGAQAGEHLGAAEALFRSMGMQLWLEQALSELNDGTLAGAAPTKVA